ncbi:MBL fold metallo-hydrolase [bacterium]|nr:MAG: MBL fold metallo-hydrolase [bacterium]
MIITWYGQSCFRIQSGDLVLITDPFSKDIGLKPPTGQADIVTVSHDHADHNNVNVIKGDPFIVDGPGEYSLKGVSVIGIPSTHGENTEDGIDHNTIYIIEIEGMRVCHLGDQGMKLTGDQIEELGDIDILFVPIGGTYTLNTSEALNVIGQVEPRVIIPMHYQINGLNIKGLEKVDTFAKEIGCKKENMNVAKVTLKKKMLPEGDNEVYVMTIS